jgi:hypothetical protein
VVKMSKLVWVAPKAQFVLVALMFTLEYGQPRHKQHEPHSWWVHDNADATKHGAAQAHPHRDGTKPIVATIAVATGWLAAPEHADANREWGEQWSRAGGADVQASAAAIVQAGWQGGEQA